MHIPSFELLLQDAFPTEFFGQMEQVKNLPESKSKKIAEAHDFQVKYKTEFCRHWLEHGFCDYGEHCAFAHGIGEIRRKPHLPNNYKTKKCKNFHELGYCTYGFRCQFLHNIPKSSLVKCSASYVPILENMENYSHFIEEKDETKIKKKTRSHRKQKSGKKAPLGEEIPTSIEFFRATNPPNITTVQLPQH